MNALESRRGRRSPNTHRRFRADEGSKNRDNGTKLVEFIAGRFIYLNRNRKLLCKISKGSMS